MRSPRPTHAVYGFLVAAVLMLTASAALAGETSFRPSYWLPENVFPPAMVVDKIFYGILYLTLVVNILVFIFMAIFLVKFRHREGRHARFIHGNNRLETVWTIVPAVILAMTAVLSESSWSNIKSPSASMATDPSVMHIEVIGRQFAWYFHYPGKDGKLGVRNPTKVNPLSSIPEELVGLDRNDPDSADDLLTTRLVVPVKQKVYANVTSVDVIHSFFLPNFRIKQDAMPGLRARVWLEATKTSAEVIGTKPDGTPKPFDIVCAELCGQGHYTMRGELYVVSPAEYEKFIAEEAGMLTPAGEAY
ncbi:MAG: cytochrome c oxidase subunit II [Planctomycetes bacterium]|nr:cytochrome c oxidase subunit II [Planctomycetota bacterium]